MKSDKKCHSFYFLKQQALSFLLYSEAASTAISEAANAVIHYIFQSGKHCNSSIFLNCHSFYFLKRQALHFTLSVKHCHSFFFLKRQPLSFIIITEAVSTGNYIFFFQKRQVCHSFYFQNGKYYHSFYFLKSQALSLLPFSEAASTCIHSIF